MEFTAWQIAQALGILTLVGYLNMQLRDIGKEVRKMREQYLNKEDTKELINMKLEPMQVLSQSIKEDVIEIKGMISHDKK